MKIIQYFYKILFFILLFSAQANAQNTNYTLSGNAKDANSGEYIIGAKVSVMGVNTANTKTNEYGFFSITLPKGTYKVQINAVGYKIFQKEIVLDKDIKQNFEIVSNAVKTKDVVVTATKATDNVTNAEMGVNKLQVAEIAKLPVIFGEKDILKTISLLPGVKSAGEGNSGFNVRGGTIDQNLILLDQAPVYNASHLLGFFSTFNSDAIKDITLYKGNSPAYYGGRLASVLDVKMLEGNEKNYQVSGGVGLIASRLSIQGPIQKDKSSFLISGRRTYADMFLKLSDKYKDNSLYFYDFNAKANYTINDKNRIYVSGYFGRDLLGLGNLFGIDWGNKTATVRWNSNFNKKWFSNTSLIYSNYDYNIKINGGDLDFTISSKIKDVNVSQEFQFYPNSKNNWKFGVNSIYHTIVPSRFQGGGDTIQYTQQKENRYGLETAFYVNNNYQPNEKFNVNYGLRMSMYSILGAGTYNIYNGDKILDSVNLNKNEFGKTYINFEPRISASYILNEKQSIKAAYSRNTQNMHLLTNSTTTSPTDQWYGDSYNIKPEIADQISTGYFRNFSSNKYEFSSEIYYKWMQNQIDYRNGADLNTSADVESQLLYGIGKAYGLELNVKKNKGNLTGWISYTLSKTQKKIVGINNDEWYNARQDRRHDLAVVAMYQVSKKWNISSIFVFNTGNAVTYPSGFYYIDNQLNYYYQNRNADRMPSYYRLDLGATYEKETTKKWHGSWNFSVYNALGRENPYVINFNVNKNTNKIEATQISLFRWVPSITYNFKF